MSSSLPGYVPKAYDFRAVERKWRRRWKGRRCFAVRNDGEPFYCVAFPPSPSGRLHLGHIVNYAIADVVARYHWMRGRDVLSPMGWDSFGLPAENHAISTGTPAATSTEDSIRDMRIQMKKAGFAFDWRREISFCDPRYYRWTQWIFLKLFHAGLAYRGRASVCYCDGCRTVLANEQVEDRRCERCGTTVRNRELEQWLFRISKYARSLHAGLDALRGKWPDPVLRMQEERIGRVDGARLDLPLVALGTALDKRLLSVFTSRPDGVHGVTFVGISPTHPLLADLLRASPDPEGLRRACDRLPVLASALYPNAESIAGAFTGLHVHNFFTGEDVPLWVCNYVRQDRGFGAVMGLPAHDRRDFLFARKYGIPIRVVIQPRGETLEPASMQAAYTGEGVRVRSGTLNGIASREEAARIVLERAVTCGVGAPYAIYRIDDWVVSRQRYWGTPIPIVYCEDCGPVGVPESELPVLLPEGVDPTLSHTPPLAILPSFVHTHCPGCGKDARRETETLDTFVDSAWYFLRFPSPHLETAPFDETALASWLPVKQCIGGIDQAGRHLIYARFLTHALADLGLVQCTEPYERLFCQGMLVHEARSCPTHGWLSREELGPDGKTCGRCNQVVELRVVKMSKSKKNGLLPGPLLERFGADTVKTALLSMGPCGSTLHFQQSRLEQTHRLFQQLYDFVVDRSPSLLDLPPAVESGETPPARRWRSLVQRAETLVAKMTSGFERGDLQLNVWILGLMDLTKRLRSLPVPRELPDRRACRRVLELLVPALNPFAAHLCAELWILLGRAGGSLFRKSWPEPCATSLDGPVRVAVHVDGKRRTTVRLERGAGENEAFRAAKASDAVRRALDARPVQRVVWIPDRLINLVTVSLGSRTDQRQAR